MLYSVRFPSFRRNLNFSSLKTLQNPWSCHLQTSGCSNCVGSLHTPPTWIKDSFEDSAVFASLDSLIRILVMYQPAPEKWFLLDGNFPQGGQGSKQSLVSSIFTASYRIMDFKAGRDLSHLVPPFDFMMRKLRHKKMKWWTQDHIV